jgi:hypothetical protein
MSKNKKKTKSVPRNSNVMSARSRVAGMAPMKSKNAPRGGQKNEQRELLEEVEEDKEDETGFAKWFDEQMKNPEFKKHYDDMVEKIANAPGLLQSLTDEQRKIILVVGLMMTMTSFDCICCGNKIEFNEKYRYTWCYSCDIAYLKGGGQAERSVEYLQITWLWHDGEPIRTVIQEDINDSPESTREIWDEIISFDGLKLFWVKTINHIDMILKLAKTKTPEEIERLFILI